MINNYKYLLVHFYDGENHACQLYSTIDEISKELNIHRTTIYKKLSSNKSEFIKDHQLYYVIKI
jgi:excisionase family DNA binding protein